MPLSVRTLADGRVGGTSGMPLHDAADGQVGQEAGERRIE
jgi:hypothetical protein